MALFSWFSKKNKEEDYEQVLASLALSIQKRQTRLSELRLRERRATLLVTSWTFAVWVAYVGLWWAGVIGHKNRVKDREREERHGLQALLWGLPVLFGPIVILFTRRIVQLWYTRKGNAEEKTLKELLVQQRNKIEEIKKKTNYYSTKSLLDRYDESGAGSKSTSGPPSPRQPPPNQPGQPGLRQRQPKGPDLSNAAPQTPQHAPAQTQVPGYSPTVQSFPPPKKQWYDKLADAILGDDTAGAASSPASRYALICERCFAHNGLVREEFWEDAQYLCPKCGHFNMSARAKKVTRQHPAPTQSSTSPVSPNNLQLPQAPASTVPREPSASPLRPHEPAQKSPLSESTVMVEKEDAEKKDGAEGYQLNEGDSSRMDVDS